MRTIIVGGGLAGLTLASALEKAGIDFVLLEARGRFDDHKLGVSIGLNVGSMYILDQRLAAQEAIRQRQSKCSKLISTTVHRSGSSDRTVVLM